MEIVPLKATLEKLAYFTKQNLNLYLNKKDEALNYWIKKLIQKEILIPIKKGFYVSNFYLDKVKDKNEMEGYLEYLAGIIRYPSYISLEYALAKYGLIPETVFSITSITQKTPRVYKSKFATFSYRNIRDSLFMGFEEKKNGKQTIRFATPSKALFDYLYLKRFSSDFELEDYLLDTGRINWEVLKKSDKVLFLKYISTISSKKMNKIVSILIQNNIL
ncbi:hypothetical protein COV49_01135 [Candidatus Falkowbacteria bacterium CG11_big_fil_rev_8_21_14_0_20_39_10]|uniref:AbiEi antitoxin C-terminal domain-containing protein n=1 Tax=Candidatus Falkowbacteria bacterium CG11_big_fil_rev_8_21_14_0_20_39_10 TaxID=1974570 RepID=A0A2M6K9M1_9BACT|nr:MAG: hypothetical protein COV49_01135 [Candidatus Falkowbacteria bacterium CG11_big_fil_rev_8_21_14_0_20_39_10]